MPACLRPFLIVFLATLLAACASSPSSTLGELPRTPQATIQQLLEQAATSEPEEAALLRLAAADQAYQRGDLAHARDILGQVDVTRLPPAQQIFFQTLGAELALADGKPEQAVAAFDHPAFARLSELPVEQQVRSQLTRAKALEAAGQPIEALRERIFIAPLLGGSQATANHEAIWALASALPDPQSHLAGAEADLAGWLNLAATVQQAGTLSVQQSAINTWRQQHPNHPASKTLPEPLAKLLELAAEPLNHIALLLPLNGQLAGVARALRDGFLAAHYQARDQGVQPLPKITLYDSSRLTSLDAFYRDAEAAKVQLVVGPLEKELVKQLAERPSLPIPTLALNYGDTGQNTPEQLYQFGLAAEDEARDAARQAWADGHRNAIALAPRGEWGARVLDAFQQEWTRLGGTVIAAEPLAEPVELAGQIAELLDLRASEARTDRLESTTGQELDTQPSRRRDADFLFLAATPQQAQQVKPTLVFQYAADLPVYGTSHLHAANDNRSQYLDLEGVYFAETPWLLDAQNPLRQAAVAQWPAAAGSLGRLYAMGADAYLLASRLPQLVAIPESELDGLSGSLSLTPSRRVERDLPWAQFRNGQAVPLQADTVDVVR